MDVLSGLPVPTPHLSGPREDQAATDTRGLCFCGLKSPLPGRCQRPSAGGERAAGFTLPARCHAEHLVLNGRLPLPLSTGRLMKNSTFSLLAQLFWRIL